MNLDDLHNQYMNTMQDNGMSLFRPEQVTAWFNEAQVEACRRALLIIDSDAPYLSLSATPGSYQFGLDDRIIWITRVKVSSMTQPLRETTLEMMDTYYPGWEATTASTPIVFFTDQKPKTLSVYPKFSANNTIKITAAREPTSALSEPYDIPEIPKRFHSLLIDWVMYRALNMRDIEVSSSLDPSRLWTANDFLASFSRSFGERPQSSDEARALMGYPRTVSFGKNAEFGGQQTTRAKQ